MLKVWNLVPYGRKWDLCMKTFVVVVADAEERTVRIYGEGTLSKIALSCYVS